MLLVIQLLIAAATLCSSISPANLHRLRNTPSLNYTFYYLHEYPLPDAFEVVIGFSRTGSNITQHLLQFRSFQAQVKAQTNKWNATFIDNSADSLSDLPTISFEQKTKVEAALFVRIKEETSLVGFVDAIKSLNFSILWIDRVRYHKLNYEIEDSKVQEAAIKKSIDICSKYFGMSFKQLVSLQKIVQDQNDNITNETDKFTGDYFDVVEKIAEIESTQQEQDDFAYFKVHIVCQNSHNASNKQKKGPKAAQQSIKIDAEYAKRLIKKDKPSQKPLKKEKKQKPLAKQRRQKDQEL